MEEPAVREAKNLTFCSSQMLHIGVVYSAPYTYFSQWKLNPPADHCELKNLTSLSKAYFQMQVIRTPACQIQMTVINFSQALSCTHFWVIVFYLTKENLG